MTHTVSVKRTSLSRLLSAARDVVEAVIEFDNAIEHGDRTPTALLPSLISAAERLNDAAIELDITAAERLS